MPKSLVTALTAVTVLSGCTFSNINLVQDQRVRIEVPRDQETVSLPMTTRWSANDVDPDLRYAVFIDTRPIAPGSTLRSLAKAAKDDACLARSGCPDAEWLSGKGVYLTELPSLPIPFLPDRRPANRTGARDAHELVIVLLDGDRRVGESSWYRQFYVQRDS